MIKKIIIFFLLIIANFAFSQVGINTEEPNANTLLHVSERLKTSDNEPNNKKGIIIPRLDNEKRTTLTANIESTAEEQNNNSLMIFNTSENCYNYWNTDDKGWNSLCGSTGNATFTYKCDTDITVHGNYVAGKETTNNEYISIEVNVTKIGDYFIAATSETDNGYSFFGSGTFTSTGTKTIYLFAQGTPKNTTFNDKGIDNKNEFTISSSSTSVDQQNNCPVPITVQLARAKYSLICSSTTVNGDYHKSKPLEQTDKNTNTITLKVKVFTTGSYYITTNTVKGVTFSARGKFEKLGTQPVTLIGSGTPTTNLDFDVTITTNTTDGNATCTATIPITLPELTIYIIGNGVWSWNTSSRTNGFNKDGVFSPKGKVRIDKIFPSSTSSTLSATTYLRNGNKPDVILYYAYNAEPDDNISNALAKYTKSGGVLIYGTSDDTQSQANKLLTGIYGEANPPVAYNTRKKNNPIKDSNLIITNTDKNDYQINNLPEDSIINGPFGNLGGKFWGEDSGGSVFVRNLPSTAIQIASAHNYADNKTISPDDSIIWYDSFHNFAYVGDSVGANNSTSSTTYPAYFDYSGLPKNKPYGKWNYYLSNNYGQKFVYNAAMDYNLLAWALKRAAEFGINKH